MKRILCFLALTAHASFTAQGMSGWRYAASWGEKGSGPLQFRDPNGISVDPRGHLYVADTGNQRIQTLNSRGEFVTEIGGFGWNAGQFDFPVAISAKNGLDVLVADHNNDRIQRFDKDLHYLSSYRSSEDEAAYLKFGLPLDVGLSSQGELFCLDGQNRRMLKFDVHGKPQRSFGDFDSGEGRLVAPHRMVIGASGFVFVSDHHPPRLVVFDPHGNFRGHIGEGILRKPMDLDVVSRNILAVADAGLQDVLLFHLSTGALHMRLSESQIGLAALKEPVDLGVWKNRLYVLDREKSQIHVFELTGLNDALD